jgi:hypothetical protein
VESGVPDAGLLPDGVSRPDPGTPGQGGLVLALITARSYGQHNTFLYRAGDSYRGMPHRHKILMNRADLLRCGTPAFKRVPVLVRGPVAAPLISGTGGRRGTGSRRSAGRRCP